MPDSELTRTSIRSLTFAYISMFLILIGLLVSGQVLTTIAHNQESQARALVVQLDTQELRTQNMFYNVLVLQSPGTFPGMTYMDIDAQVAKDEAVWEQEGKSFYDNMHEFPAPAQALLTQGRANFLNMQAAYRSVLATEKKDNPAPITVVRPAINVIYIDERPYLDMLVNVNSAVTKEADAYSVTVRNVELILSILCVAVVSGEALFIARPAIRSLRAHLDTLARVLHPNDPKGSKP